MKDRGVRTGQVEEKIKSRKVHQSNLTKKINEEAQVRAASLVHCMEMSRGFPLPIRVLEHFIFLHIVGNFPHFGWKFQQRPLRVTSHMLCMLLVVSTGLI